MGKAVRYACIMVMLLAISAVAFACDAGNDNRAIADCAAHPKKVLVTECTYRAVSWRHRADNAPYKIDCNLKCVDAKVKARTIFGTVAESGNQDETLAGAAVTLTKTTEMGVIRYVWNETTDENGNFNFPDGLQGEGVYTVDVDADGYVSQTQTADNTRSKKGVAMYFNLDPEVTDVGLTAEVDFVNAPADYYAGYIGLAVNTGTGEEDYSYDGPTGQQVGIAYRAPAGSTVSGSLTLDTCATQPWSKLLGATETSDNIVLTIDPNTCALTTS